MSVELTNKIAPCLWHDDKAEEAANFYVDLFNSSPHAASFPKSFIAQKTHYMKNAKQMCTDFEAGTVLNVVFQLAGQELMTLNGGPMFKFSPAISLMIECADQAEIDHFFDGFSEGVKERELNCGWVNDRYGVSWQIVPRYMRELVVNEPDRTKYNNLHVWMMKTLPKKFVLKDMVEAAEGNASAKE